MTLVQGDANSRYMASTPSTFTARVTFLREKAGVSARELDRLAGLAEGHVSMLELRERRGEGGSRPHSRTAIRLATVLGASLEFLLLGEGAAPSTATMKAAVAAARRRAQAA